MYRKKPVIINAFQWNEGEPWVEGMELGANGSPVIKTLEGEMIVTSGDYIITGVKGERYPCKPDIFEKTYEPAPTPGSIEIMNFGGAIAALKDGKKVARSGWNGKGMFLYYVPENSYPAQTQVAKDHFGEMVAYNPYIAIKNVNGTVSTWVPSINDCLAEDWQVV